MMKARELFREKLIVENTNRYRNVLPLSNKIRKVNAKWPKKLRHNFSWNVSKLIFLIYS